MDDPLPIKGLAAVRMTTDPAYYEQHSGSVELWSPGNPLFQPPEFAAPGSPGFKRPGTLRELLSDLK